MVFSERSSIAHEPDAIGEAAARRRARGEDVLDLTRASPPPVQLADLRDAPARVPAREAIAEDRARDGLETEPWRVVLTSSAGSAREALLTLLCDPGDEVLVPEPGTRQLEPAAQAHGVTLAPYPLACPFDGGQPDPMALWDAIGPRTRAIVAAHPAPPTGAYLSPDTVEALAALDVPWIVDETAYGLPLEVALEPPRVHPDALAFTLDSLDERAPGAGLAWIVVHGEIAQAEGAVERLARITERSGASPLLEAMTPALLAHARARRAATREHARSALAVVRAAAAGTSLEVPPVAGGSLVPVRVPRAGGTSDEQALALVDHGARALSGSLLGFPEDESWLVLGLLTPLDDLARGMERLRSYVERGRRGR